MAPPKIFAIVPVSVFYRNARATALGKAFSVFWAVWAAWGLPPRRQVGLQVRGRRTGRMHTSAVVVAKVGNEEYLVSMLGECEWVKNARAASEAYLISGRRRRVKLEEIAPAQRAPVIKEYLRLAPGARPHIGLTATASIADCERVAAKHPVFRILARPDTSG